MPNAHVQLIEDLENTIADKNIGDRAAMLRRVTDLFKGASGQLSKEHIALFGDVMERLLVEIETSARVAFSHLLATTPDAPPQVIRILALDDAIDVAGVVLTNSEQVDESALVETARTKSQAHLLAISCRRTLTVPITDILVTRGNNQVALSTAENPGAAFSDFGYSHLVRRASNDVELATRIWIRPDLPRQHLLKLFADASEAVQNRLTSLNPRRAEEIREAVAQAAQLVQNCARENSENYAAAYSYVQALSATGDLGEAQLEAFAAEGKFDETTIALSIVCNLPVAMIERAFVDERPVPIIIITKANNFSWSTVKSILLLQREANNCPTLGIDQLFTTFNRIKVETAKKAIQFYRLREQSTTPAPI